jgi:hypothetical protein
MMLDIGIQNTQEVGVKTLLPEACPLKKAMLDHFASIEGK